MKLKHRIFQMALPLLVLTLGVSSCTEFLDEGKLDDQIYLQKRGLTEATVFNWGTFTYKLPIIKSGKGSQAASLKLVVDEAVMNKYNDEKGTAFQVLPADCYKLKQATLNFAASDYRKEFLIDFNPEALAIALESGNDYVLPCRVIKVSGTTISFSKEIENPDEVIIKPSLDDPYIGFDVPGFYATGSSFSINTDDDDVLEIFPKIVANFYNNWTIKYKVEVDPAVLNAYNQENNTNYKVLPEGAYTIDKSTAVMKPNRDYEYLKVTLKESALHLEGENFAFGSYALPLKITEVSKYGIDPDAQTTIYPVIFEPNTISKDKWAVPDTLSGGVKASNSIITEEIENVASTSVPANLIDKKDKSYWCTRVIAPTSFPYYATISLQEDCKLYRLSVQLPSANSKDPLNVYSTNAKAGYFAVSDDGVTWTKVKDWSRESEDSPREVIVDTDMVHAKYIRIYVTDAFNYADPTVGKASGAVVQIAEITAWGI